jgi:hypothetical protein
VKGNEEGMAWADHYDCLVFSFFRIGFTYNKYIFKYFKNFKKIKDSIL